MDHVRVCVEVQSCYLCAMIFVVFIEEILCPLHLYVFEFEKATKPTDIIEYSLFLRTVQALISFQVTPKEKGSWDVFDVQSTLRSPGMPSNPLKSSPIRSKRFRLCYRGRLQAPQVPQIPSNFFGETPAPNSSSYESRSAVLLRRGGVPG